MKSLLQFFLFTFILSWAAFITASAISQSTQPGGSGFTTAGYIIYLVGVFAPALVALLISWRQNKNAGLTSLLGKILKTPRGWYWYLFAIAYFLVIKLVAALVCRIATGYWPGFGKESVFLIVAGIVFSTPVQAGEEIGWRGFALPRLTTHFGLAAASIILGIVWAAWHLPFFFFPVADKFGQSFPMYLLSVVAISVTMAWLYWRTNGSLLLTMLMHSAINNTTGIVPSALPGADDLFSWHASPVAWITTALLWALAIFFLIKMRGANAEIT